MIYEDYLHCIGYEGQEAHPSEAGVSAFFEAESQRYFFSILDADGKVLLKSEGYPQEATRENGIQSVLKNRANRDFYSVKSYDNGRFYLSLRAGNYREIARSCSASTEAEALALLPYLMGEQVRGGVVAATEAAPVESSANKIDDDYMICREYRGHDGVGENGLVKFSHSNGKHYFAWYDEDGEVLMRSEAYPTTAARDNGLASVEKNRDIEARYSITERMGRYFVILKAGNHQEIARSCPYSSEEAALALYPTARAMRQKTSIVTETEPVVEAIAPEIEVVEPVVEAIAPEVEIIEPVVEEIAPVVEVVEPVVETIAPKVEVVTTDVTTPLASVESATIAGTFTAAAVIGTIHSEPVTTSITRIAPEAPTTTTVIDAPKDVDDDYLPCRDYEGRSINDKANNVALFKHDNGQFYFAIYAEDGSVRLRSEGFATGQERDVELSGVIKNLNNAEMYSVLRRGNYFINVLKDKTGREVGRSCLQKDPPPPPAPEPEPIVEAIAPMVIPEVVPEPVVEVIAPVVEVAPPAPALDVEDDYLPCKDYEGHDVNDKDNNVALFQHSNGQYYFALYDGAGKVHLRSEGFLTSEDREKELTVALKHLYNPDRYSTIRKGDYYIRILKDRQGKEVGRSCLQKDEPKPIVAPIAVAAVAAVIPEIKVEVPKVEIPEVKAEIPKVEVPIIETPKVEIKAPFIETVTPIVEEEATGGFKWWWLLPILALAIWWFSKDGCKKPAVTTPSVTAVPVDTLKTVEPTPAVAKAESCDLNWIFFDFNKADLRTTAKTELDQMVSILKKNPDYVALLSAHADFKGSDAYNQALSGRRATNAKKYLVANGIAASRIKTNLSGEKDPIAKNEEDDRVRQYNRRVELYVQNKEGKNVCESIPPVIEEGLKANQ
jgi:outer membrane protein OmpA-like peptidoglycan-associated protein/uncharacterized protein YegP (UPF0339 family)